MTVPTAHLAFDEPIRFVVPMIRAALTGLPSEAGHADVRRADLPEVAVLSDCRHQYGEEGLNQLTAGLPVAAAAGINMKAALLHTEPLALAEQFVASVAIEHAVTDPGRDVLWEYAASIIHVTVSGDLTRRPSVEDVLSEVHDKYGTDGLLDVLLCLAQFTAAVLRDMGSAAMQEHLLGLIDSHLDKFAAYLRTAKIID